MNSKKPVKVVAVGAAGPAAGLVVPQLLKRGAIVRGFVHKPMDASTAAKSEVSEIVVGELADSQAVQKAVTGMDAVFYIAPAKLGDEAEVGKRFVAAAKQAGVRRFVFSSVIHPILSELDNHAAKAPVEEALLDSGMEYVFLHPGLFYQNFTSSWPKVIENGSYAEPWSADTRFSRVDYRDVAEVAAIAITEDRLLFGTFELCAEGILNRHEVVALMSDVLGRTVSVATVDQHAMSNMPSKLGKMVAWYDKHPLLGNATTLRAILGREPRTLRSFFQELNNKAV
jgi:uncharacterized protein YbjT (DUF2867 family)